MNSGAGGSGPPMRPLREKAEEALIEAYARDELDDGELERRLDLVHRAERPEELVRLLSDLPAPVAGPPAPAGEGGGRELRRTEQSWTLAPPGRVRARQFLAGVLGGSTRKGQWTPARHILAAACMGGVDLDFRQAALPPGVTTVTVIAIMGGVTIVVPPGVGVDCGGIGIMGGFDATDHHPADPDGPVIRIDGLAMMGGVEVKVRPISTEGGKGRKRLGRGGNA